MIVPNDMFYQYPTLFSLYEEIQKTINITVIPGG